MSYFEFVVEGPPGATANTKENNTRRYKRWVDTVGEAARKQWPSGTQAVVGDIASVQVTNYYRVTKDRPHPPDVDNILKPILDAMNKLVYEDDKQVCSVTSDRFDLAEPVFDAEPVLAEGLARYRELLYIRVSWKDDDN